MSGYETRGTNVFFSRKAVENYYGQEADSAIEEGRAVVGKYSLNSEGRYVLETSNHKLQTKDQLKCQ